MPIDGLTALGQKMREARKNKELTQQELSDLSHVSVKQIANIEKGKMNPSYLILRALARSYISLDTLINQIFLWRMGYQSDENAFIPAVRQKCVTPCCITPPGNGERTDRVVREI